MRTDPALPIVALDISPLAERFHTGIANVTKHLARQMLDDDTVDGRFLFNRGEIARDLVEPILAMDGGEILWWLASRTFDATAPAPDPDRIAIGIYSNHKWHRRLYPTEVQIVHDITTLVTPWFHDDQNISTWQSRLLADMLSSDLIVAVSESTRADILTYYPQLAPIPCVVASLATTIDAPQALADLDAVERYVLVLGTLEPRKNLKVVFELLGENKDLLDGTRFIFAGRRGWALDTEALIRSHGLDDAVRDGRIVFTGFVSDAARDELMRHARCVLYISHYEGFGLPVLEALSVGAPVITGIGSSLPEAGGDRAVYCDVGSAASVAAALRGVLGSPASVGARERRSRQDWAARFHWS
ncbi:MAG TPA: glycosyltransferase family 1 protein, partial [Rhizomicrobium sp.]